MKNRFDEVRKPLPNIPRTGQEVQYDPERPVYGRKTPEVSHSEQLKNKIAIAKRKQAILEEFAERAVPMVEEHYESAGLTLKGAKDAQKIGFHDQSQLGRKVGSNSNRKLTPQQVREIRKSKEFGYDLAPKYGVSVATINKVRARTSYKDVV